MFKTIILLFISFFLFGCSKMQEKKPEDSKSSTQQAPMTNKSENTPQTDSKSSGQEDEKATELSKIADEAIVKYSTDKSDNTKAEVIQTSLAAGNYLMFEASLPAREKYRPALKYYRQVLELDPSNEEAIKNKTQIEDIYKQMGMPVPQ